MNKSHIRERILKIRAGLNKTAVSDASRAVTNRLRELPELQNAVRVMVYADFRNEISVGALTGWLMFENKEVFLPVVRDLHIEAIRYHGHRLTPGAAGVPEPPYSESDRALPDELDVVIVPGVAYSANLDRIGFGKGYYDRFLEEASRACRIAPAYDFQIVNEFDTDPHDMRMNMIVTPTCVMK